MSTSTIIRNVLAVVAGIFVGSVVNMGIVNVGPVLIPLPVGADVSSVEGLQKSMALFRPIHFLAPFLGHALGTLIGATFAAAIAGSGKKVCAMAVGLFFLFGGIAMVSMVGGPLWFVISDLLLAYLPMGWIGGIVGSAINPVIERAE